VSPRPVILVLIDGLTPSMLEGAIGSGDTPTLAALAAHGDYGRATSVFPSLTPVCLSSIATGAHGDVHEIPHLVWLDRREGRVIEYGSSFQAVRAAGIGNTLRDTLVNMNSQHLGTRAVTLFEALADAALRTAAVNFTAYRGRTRHQATVPFLGTVSAPERFFFYNLYSSDRTGAPLSWRNRAAGTIDAYAAAVGRWLVARDAFDFLLFYLSDYDYASHAQGPDAAHAALARCDEAVGALIEAAGGPDEFLERYAVILCSDHGQTPVSQVARLQDAFPDALVTASNRAGMIYTADDPATLARRLDGNPAVDVVLWRDGDRFLARRGGADGDVSQLDHPDGPVRAAAALANPNAGELIVSAAAGWEFADLAGRHHAGGGSHGSLLTGDSEVPMLVVGLDVLPASIVEVMPAVLDHFGVPAPSYARTLTKA
jgi:predicted AlkP superfamily pyrophosphatase or phosphodiesterase